MALVTNAGAQSISVVGSENENGYGWMFRWGQACYAIMPRHVAGEKPRLNVQSAAPVEIGSGFAIRPFWPEMDLALGVVRGNITSRCTGSLDQLRPSRQASAARRLYLHRLTSSGEEERVPIQITARDYLTIEAEPASADAEIYQGTSGAMAFAAGQPVGMAIKSDNPGHVRLMRSEEIFMNVNRYLNEQGIAFEAETEPAPAAQEAGFLVTVQGTTVPPVSPDMPVENVLGDGLFVFGQTTESAAITFAVEGSAPATLRRARITTPIDAGYALPKRILVFAGQGESPDNMRIWARGEMSPDGIFDTGVIASVSADWIRVMIVSARASGPVAIDRITFP